MDHSRSLRAVHHDQLKKPSCAIGAEKQIPNGVFGDLLDDQCVAHNVFNVFRFDGVPERRAEDLHGQYCTTKPAALASARGSTPGDRMDAGENTPTQRRFGVLGASQHMLAPRSQNRRPVEAAQASAAATYGPSVRPSPIHSLQIGS